ncbi:MAG TPA: FG-GAP-like repeat-containing protein [Vicinamibacterales bacterium]|nr:FG-GAP-like repeat-containing protein [Vicinamibacterales bacterium]
MPSDALFRRRAGGLCAATLLAAAIACGTPSPPPSQNPSRDTRERAYRANNVGVALLEQLNYPEAAAAFRNALITDSTLAIARLNLSLALMYEQDLDGALTEATQAATLMPAAPQPAYVLGLLARAQNRNGDARRFFEQVRQIDAADVGANVNLAQINLEDRRYDEAVSVLQPVVEREPYHVTASYVLGLALTRGGKPDEGQRLLQRAQDLRRASYAVTFGTGYLEQGRYAEAMASTGAEPELVDQTTPSAKFTAAAIGVPQPAADGDRSSPFNRRFAAADLGDEGVRQLAAGLGGGQALVDLDADGTLEIVIVGAAGQRIVRIAAGGDRQDVTAGSGLEAAPRSAVAVGVVSADYDNDGAPDLFVLRASASSLYRNDGKGHFTDVTRGAKLPPFPGLPGAAAFVDVDHDGDVDLLIAGLADVAATRRLGGGPWLFPSGFVPAPLQLLRNNGNGTFTDVTRAARLERRGHAIAIAPTDFDNHRDIDLLVVNADGPPQLYANQRDGSFRDVAASVGLTAPGTADELTTAAAIGDVNKDDWPDFFLARTAGSVFALSDGRGRFNLSSAPPSVRGASAAQFVDYDNDGLLDLAALTSSGLTVVRNVGPSWVDVTGTAVAPTTIDARSAVRSMAVADIDRDGAADIVATTGSQGWAWHNSGEARNRSVRVQLKGRVSNRTGVGAKVQVRAGSLSARFETSAATPAVASSEILFGLGARAGADVSRVLWPSGILQAETAPGGNGQPPGTLPSPFVVEELDRKPSSCPFLFVWNGERFEFVTDFLGGGEMGYWESPGVYNRPDPVEYVRIPGERLKAVSGRLQLRVTNELEEVLYLDRMQLTTLTHPAGVEVYPNEGMTADPKPSRLLAVQAAHTPQRVTDEHGHDVTARIASLDRRWPDDFTLAPIRGYAARHALTIDLGPSASASALLLTGWTDYAFSSDNVAARQAGLTSEEPVLEAQETSGRWRRLAVAIGIPVGRPQTIPLDLSGALEPGEHVVRLSTSMRIYWDQIRVGVTVPADGFRSSTVNPRSASLRWRGFSAEVRPDGEDPPGYDYARVTPDSPWKVFAGDYTREGDVLPLLTRTDDQFVISKPGDEVALEFDEGAGVVPPGWVRTYLLVGDGFSKEMDVNSASPDTVEPLPFHGMSRYPYPAGEHYPDTAEHEDYRRTYNTRRVARQVPHF